MGDWFPGCIIKHEFLSELFLARKVMVLDFLSKNRSLFPGRCPLLGASRGSLGGLSRSHSFLRLECT